jgi:hypothetical protein
VSASNNYPHYFNCSCGSVPTNQGPFVVGIDECHIDHIQSGKRGSNEMPNLRTLCRRCHVLRADHRHQGMIAKRSEMARFLQTGASWFGSKHASASYRRARCPARTGEARPVLRGAARRYMTRQGPQLEGGCNKKRARLGQSGIGRACPGQSSHGMAGSVRSRIKALTVKLRAFSPLKTFGKSSNEEPQIIGALRVRNESRGSVELSGPIAPICKTILVIDDQSDRSDDDTADICESEG